jgi:hypothetical protein
MTEVDQVRASTNDLSSKVADVDKSNAVMSTKLEEVSEGIARVELLIAEGVKAQAVVTPQQSGFAALIAAAQANPRMALMIGGTIFGLFTATLEGRTKVSETLDVLAVQQEKMGQIADALGIPENMTPNGDLHYELTDPIGEADGNEEEN